MRFHMGVSFSWRTFKKYLIPFLLGFLGYFGFNWIYENFNLGFLQVNALEFNQNGLYCIYYDDNTSSCNTPALNSINNSNYYSTSSINTYNSSLDEVWGVNNITFAFYNQSFCDNTNYGGIYNFKIYYNHNFIVSPLEKVVYTDLTNYLDCNINSFNGNYSDISCNIPYKVNTSTIGIMLYLNDNIDSNDIGNNISTYFGLSQWNQTACYTNSNIDVIFNNNFNTNNIIDFINNEINKVIDTISIGNSTQEDIYDYISNNPNNPNNPVDNTQHKALFNKIYWFDDNTTVLGILSSIYELLFIYCLLMIFFKILTFIKNVRW